MRDMGFLFSSFTLRVEDGKRGSILRGQYTELSRPSQMYPRISPFDSLTLPYWVDRALPLFLVSSDVF